VPADSIVRVAAASASSDLTAAADAGLAAADGRPLVIVVRDAHRYPGARHLVTRLLAARPDAVVVEMGLPIWRPPHGGYVATYGAARINGLAAAEILGLAPGQGA
jgi:beta-N-acetylhexosaminidase